MEVLVALGIFAIGFVAIAAIFPAGILLQRNTADEVMARQVESNAEAIIAATQLTYTSAAPSTGDLSFYHTTSSDTRSDTMPFPSTAAGSYRSLDELWALGTRSYPQSMARENDRQVYWVPLVCDTAGNADAPTWQIYAFVMVRRDNSTYWTGSSTSLTDASPTTDADSIPHVLKFTATASNTSSETTLTFTSVPAGVGLPTIGDQILCSEQGKVLTVTGILGSNQVTVDTSLTNGTYHIWYAPPPKNGTASPTQAIVTITPTVN